MLRPSFHCSMAIFDSLLLVSLMSASPCQFTTWVVLGQVHMRIQLSPAPAVLMLMPLGKIAWLVHVSFVPWLHLASSFLKSEMFMSACWLSWLLHLSTSLWPHPALLLKGSMLCRLASFLGNSHPVCAESMRECSCPCNSLHASRQIPKTASVAAKPVLQYVI